MHNDKGEVAFVDTTGSFSPQRLRDVLIFRLSKESRQPKFRPMLAESRTVDDGITQKAFLMLDRVKVMRVFDFAGVTEAIAEIRQTLEKADNFDRNLAGASLSVESKIIHDSEADETELSDGDISKVAKQDNAIPAVNGERQTIQANRIGMVIIDTLTNMVSSMFSRNQAQGIYHFKPTLTG